MSIGQSKIQLAISIWFISSRNPEQFRIRRSHSKNIEIMSGGDIDDVINNLIIILQEWMGVDIVLKGLCC